MFIIIRDIKILLSLTHSYAECSNWNKIRSATEIATCLISKQDAFMILLSKSYYVNEEFTYYRTEFKKKTCIVAKMFNSYDLVFKSCNGYQQLMTYVFSRMAKRSFLF